jgi:putative transposase
LILTKRHRTSANDIGYGLYLYFLGLSYRNTAKALSFRFKKRTHIAIWKWIQKYKPEKVFCKRRKISGFIVDETQIKVGKDYFWLWVVAIKPKDKDILHIHIFQQKETHVCCRTFSTFFFSKEVRKIPCFN